MINFYNGNGTLADVSDVQLICVAWRTGACEIHRPNRYIHRFTTSHSVGRKHNPLRMPGIFQFTQNVITMISLERTISIKDVATVQFIIAYIALAIVMFTVLDPRPQ